MALYAFDGTGNDDRPENTNLTNVVKFRDVYQQKREYEDGVGTREGGVGLLFGGVFGTGGRTRIEEMYEKLLINWKAGDHVIDIIGFSRGAALAIHFSNVITKKGLAVGVGGSLVKSRVRFLGVWDVVGSFGIPIDIGNFPFHNINLGWDFTVSEGVDHCVHAMALNEHREAFVVTRLNDKPNVKELWFRGVHSDVGGGNEDSERHLPNISLKWMLEQAIACGLPIQPDVLHDIHGDPRYRLFKNLDPVDDGPRTVLAGDEFHETAKSRMLAVGESATCSINSPDVFCWTGLQVAAGQTYQFSVPSTAEWSDGRINCRANGWKSEDQSLHLRIAFKLVEPLRRVHEADWFELIGSVGDDTPEFFRIGLGTTYSPNRSGDLFAFANDLIQKYENNSGSVPLTIRRIS